MFPGLSKKIEEAEFLVFMGNGGEYIPSRKSISSLPLVAVIWSSLHKSFGHNRKRIIGRLSGLGRKVQSLPMDYPPAIFHRTNNAGLTAVALAALRSTEVHIFGIDFYETGFLTAPDFVGWRGDLSKMSGYGSELISHFEWLTTKFPDVKFHLTTQATRMGRQYSNLSVTHYSRASDEHRSL